MGIFRILQKLRHSTRSSRLLQLLLFAIGITVIVFGMIFNSRKSPLRERALTCCNGDQVVLFFPSPRSLIPAQVRLPLKTKQTDEDLAFVEVDVGDEKWHAVALRTFSVGDLMADLTMKGVEKYPFPLIAIAQDSSKAEYLIISGKNRQISLSSMKHLIELDKKNENLVEVKIPNHQKQDFFSFLIKVTQNSG
jgi:hypothetical protein